MPVFMKMDGIDSIGPENSAKDGTSNTLMIGEHVPTSVEHALTYGAAVSPSQAFNEPNADRHEFAIKKAVDATSPTVAPDIDDEVLAFSHDERSNDSIWIDIGAPIMRAFEGSREYVLTQPEHAATDEAQSSPPVTGYGNLSSFQIISAGADAAGSRLFVGNLTMHSEAYDEPWGEALISGEEDAVKVPAVQTGGWIADVTYERLASPREDDAFHTETIHSTEGAYSGSYLLYQDVVIF
jgi:hypothetical protein